VSGTADLERLQELNRGFIRSVRTSDVAWFDRNLSEDFLNSNADGTLVDRAAFLRQIAPACPLSNFDVEDVRIRILGDTALVHGRTTYVKPDGQTGAGRYTDVWVRQGGRWVCVSGDVTRG
jgi:ketosteroid isomerase-like protein